MYHNLVQVYGRATLAEDDTSECDGCSQAWAGRRCEVHQKQEELRLALAEANIQWRYRQCTVDNWDPVDSSSPSRTERNVKHKEFLRSWAMEPKGFVGLCGPSGTGKTHMASAVCWLRVSQGLAVSYVSAPQMMAELIGERGLLRDRLKAFLGGLAAGKLLVLDDLGWRQNNADTEVYRRIVSVLYDGEMPMLWATNHLPTTLPVDGPTLSRLQSGYTLPFVGKDRRRL